MLEAMGCPPGPWPWCFSHSHGFLVSSSTHPFPFSIPAGPPALGHYQAGSTHTRKSWKARLALSKALPAFTHAEPSRTGVESLKSPLHLASMGRDWQGWEALAPLRAALSPLASLPPLASLCLLEGGQSC